MATMTRLAEAHEAPPGIVLTTVNAAMQRVPGREFIANSALTVKVGDWLEMGALTDFFAQAGYCRSSKVLVSVSLQSAAGSLTSFPPAVRSQFGSTFLATGWTVRERSIHETQMSVGRVAEVKICRDTEISLERLAVERFRRLYRSEFGTPHKDDRLYAAVSNGLTVSGLEHWLPFFHERMETVFDYLPDATVCIDDHVEQLCEQRFETLRELYSNRSESPPSRPQAPATHRPVSPELLYMDRPEFSGKLNLQPVRQIFAHKRPNGSWQH